MTCYGRTEIKKMKMRKSKSEVSQCTRDYVHVYINLYKANSPLTTFFIEPLSEIKNGNKKFINVHFLNSPMIREFARILCNFFI